MRCRYIYAILFGIPGLLLAFFLTLIIFGMTMGVLWLFVFGDNTWPAAVDTVVPTLMGLVFLVLWGGAIAGGYLLGKRREAGAALNWTHVLISAAVTVVLLALVGVLALAR
jgi:hypothetical protein